MRQQEKSRLFHNKLRRLVAAAQPTDFHREVRQWQLDAEKDNIEFIVCTQNVDDLFEKAGVQNVLHVHGDVRYLQCLGFNHRWFIGYDNQEEDVR